MCELCQPSLASMSRRSSWWAEPPCSPPALCPSLSPAPISRSTTPPPNAIPPAEALDRLMQGNARYVAGETECKDYLDRPRRARGRAISDRGDAELLRQPRVARACLRPGTGRYLRRARCGQFRRSRMGWRAWNMRSRFFGVPLLMVLGHTNCGAVSAAVKVVTEHAELPGHLPELVESIEPAVIAAHARHPSDLVAAAIEENVRLNVKRLIDDTPIVADALAAEKIAISGGIYDIATGKVGLI